MYSLYRFLRPCLIWPCSILNMDRSACEGQRLSPPNDSGSTCALVQHWGTFGATCSVRGYVCVYTYVCIYIYIHTVYVLNIYIQVCIHTHILVTLESTGIHLWGPNVDKSTREEIICIQASAGMKAVAMSQVPLLQETIWPRHTWWCAQGQALPTCSYYT